MSFTLEITGKDIAQIADARALIPAGTPVKIAFLGNETHEQRLNAARVIHACGLAPEPIISSRRLVSQSDADGLIERYQTASPTRFFIVGGDPSTPAGPFGNAMQLMESGILARHGITKIGIAGHPEGHPKATDQVLWDALDWKRDFLNKSDVSFEITTQFGLDPDAVVDWIAALRGRGFDNLVRIGVPGPTDAGKLLRFAQRFGVKSSLGVLRRYGISLTKLLHPVGPERFLQGLDRAMRDKAAQGVNLGPIGYHLYTFGGVEQGLRWLHQAAHADVAQDVPENAGNIARRIWGQD